MENTPVVPISPAGKALAAAKLELRRAARAYVNDEPRAAVRLENAANAHAAALANWEINRP